MTHSAILLMVPVNTHEHLLTSVHLVGGRPATVFYSLRALYTPFCSMFSGSHSENTSGGFTNSSTPSGRSSAGCATSFGRSGISDRTAAYSSWRTACSYTHWCHAWVDGTLWPLKGSRRHKATYFNRRCRKAYGGTNFFRCSSYSYSGEYFCRTCRYYCGGRTVHCIVSSWRKIISRGFFGATRRNSGVSDRRSSCNSRRSSSEYGSQNQCCSTR